MLGTLNSTASSRHGMRIVSHPLGGLPPSPAAAWLQDLPRNWGARADAAQLCVGTLMAQHAGKPVFGIRRLSM